MIEDTHIVLPYHAIVQKRTKLVFQISKARYRMPRNSLEILIIRLRSIIMLHEPNARVRPDQCHKIVTNAIDTEHQSLRKLLQNNADIRADVRPDNRAHAVDRMAGDQVEDVCVWNDEVGACPFARERRLVARLPLLLSREHGLDCILVPHGEDGDEAPAED